MFDSLELKEHCQPRRFRQPLRCTTVDKCAAFRSFFCLLASLCFGLHSTAVAICMWIAEATFNRLFGIRILFLYHELKPLFPWLSREQVNCYMLKSFQNRYPHTRIIIDCKELQIQCP